MAGNSIGKYFRTVFRTYNEVVLLKRWPLSEVSLYHNVQYPCNSRLLVTYRGSQLFYKKKAHINHCIYLVTTTAGIESKGKLIHVIFAICMYVKS